MLSKTHIEAYNRIRQTADKSVLCHAPFTNLNFEQNGNMTACCFNRVEVLGRYPEQSIAEAWMGKEAELLRKRMRSNDLGGGCKLCRILIESGNYAGTKAIHYDEYAQPRNRKEKLRSFLGLPLELQPRVFEFEISNVCNLACDMCNGYFSSTIRKNREQLPPLPYPYDDAFVNQVAEFMPYLTDMKFLGGEPFLVDHYFDIWDRAMEVNPRIRMHITTNGTVLNQKAKTLLEKLYTGIVVSIDSLDPENYEKIRVGAKFERVMENLEYFRQVAEKKKTYLSIATCLMSNNWRDIPEMVRFANEKEISLHFNVVWNPGHRSLRFLDFGQLEEIEQFFESFRFEPKGEVQERNVNNFREAILIVKHWKKERSFTRLVNPEKDISLTRISQPDILQSLPDNPEFKALFYYLLARFAMPEPERLSLLEDALSGADRNLFDESRKADPQDYLFGFWRDKGDILFMELFFNSLPWFYRLFFGEEGFSAFREKTGQMQALLRDQKTLQAVLSDLVDDLNRRTVANQVLLFRDHSFEDLAQHISENY